MKVEHGQPSAYLVDVDDYEFMQQRMAILEGVARGEQAIKNGETFSNQEVNVNPCQIPVFSLKTNH